MAAVGSGREGESGAASPRAQAPGSPVGHDLTTQTSKGMLWTTLSFLITRGSGFVVSVVLARLLGPSEFGLVASALVIVTFTEVALDLGVGAFLIYEQEEGQSRRVHTAFTLNVIVGSVVTAVLLVAAPAISEFFNADDVAIFRAIALLVLLRSLVQIPNALFKRDMLFNRRTAVDLTRGVLRVGVAVVLGVAGYGAWALVWALFAAEIAGIAMTWVLLRFRPTFAFDVAFLRQMLGYSTSVLGVGVLGEVALNADYFVVANRLGQQQLGVYFVAFRIPQIAMLQVYNVFAQVTFPAYSRAREMGSASLRKGALRGLRLLFLYAAPVGTTLALLSRDLLNEIFDTKWAAAEGPMMILCIAGIFVGVGYASGEIFNAIGRPQIVFKLTLVMVPLLIVALVLAAPHGLVSVALVHLVVSATYSLVRLVVAARLLHLSLVENLRALSPGVATAMGAAVLGTPVRLLTAGSWLSLAAIAAACGVGGVIALRLADRSAFGEIADLARRALLR